LKMLLHKYKLPGPVILRQWKSRRDYDLFHAGCYDVSLDTSTKAYRKAADLMII
jgi:hypothetical protein